MKQLISKAWAEILAIIYEGETKFHHINNNGYWEFEIRAEHSGELFCEDPVIYYKTKGLR